MVFFIAQNGKIYTLCDRNGSIKPFPLEEQYGIENLFCSRESALLMRDVMEINKPRIFL